MKPEDIQNNYSVEDLIALADYYDRSGQYHRADEIYKYLEEYHMNSLPTELKLKITQHTSDNSQSMSSSECSRGYVPVRYNPDAYISGKGQACYRDSLPMNKQFV